MRSVLGLAALLGLLAGCQQPVRCGAIGEECCPEGCYAGSFCVLGTCSATAPASCPGTTGPCDLALQNCPPGQGCGLDGITTSCAATGGARSGDPCMLSTECVAGHYCSRAEAVCRPYCCGACPTGQLCIESSTVSAAGFCVSSGCDPLSTGGCGPSGGCYPLGDQLACLPAGTVGIGGACTSVNECVPGAACLASGTCAQVCRPAAPSCAVGTCAPFSGAGDFGACVGAP